MDTWGEDNQNLDGKGIRMKTRRALMTRFFKNEDDYNDDDFREGKDDERVKHNI